MKSVKIVPRHVVATGLEESKRAFPAAGCCASTFDHKRNILRRGAERVEDVAFVDSVAYLLNADCLLGMCGIVAQSHRLDMSMGTAGHNTDD
ncbi:MAG TPA: hypothetical protein VN786_11980, partial [Acidimicrobiales bacterium]|nr:hypothetical protein [Acidimicrobiales bacterium]